MEEFLHLLVNPAHWGFEAVSNGVSFLLAYVLGWNRALRRHDRKVHGLHSRFAPRATLPCPEEDCPHVSAVHDEYGCKGTITLPSGWTHPCYCTLGYRPPNEDPVDDNGCPGKDLLAWVRRGPGLDRPDQTIPN